MLCKEPCREVRRVEFARFRQPHGITSIIIRRDIFIHLSRQRVWRIAPVDSQLRGPRESCLRGYRITTADHVHHTHWCPFTLRPFESRKKHKYTRTAQTHVLLVPSCRCHVVRQAGPTTSCPTLGSEHCDTCERERQDVRRRRAPCRRVLEVLCHVALAIRAYHPRAFTLLS